MDSDEFARLMKELAADGGLEGLSQAEIAKRIEKLIQEGGYEGLEGLSSAELAKLAKNLANDTASSVGGATASIAKDVPERQAKDAAEEKRTQEAAAEKKRQEEVARQKAEAERKAAEEKALAEKNKRIQEQMTTVKDEMALGKAAANSGDYDTAIQHFNAAKDNLPKEQKAFAAEHMAEAALMMRNASDGIAEPGVSDGSRTAGTGANSSIVKKKKTAAAANDFANTAALYDPKNAAAHYVFGKGAEDVQNWPTALD